MSGFSTTFCWHVVTTPGSAQGKLWPRCQDGLLTPHLFMMAEAAATVAGPLCSALDIIPRAKSRVCYSSSSTNFLNILISFKYIQK